MTSPDHKVPIVLLVDDDPGDQELTRRALASDNLHVDLRVVEDGEQAMDYLAYRGPFADPATAPRPDLILLDLNMPRMDGRAVLQQLSSVRELKRIPVVVLTTSKQEEDILRSYDLGCNSFISKPVNIEDFIEVIHQLGIYWFGISALPSQ